MRPEKNHWHKEKEAEKIRMDARAEGEKNCSQIVERSKQEVQSSLSRAESAANLQEKKLILNAKQEIINNLIHKAKETLINLPDKEYFETILRMIRKNALPGEGIILFSERDLKRLPEGFSKSVTEALSVMNGAKLNISQDSCNINGGFLLSYGDVEMNCSFDALIAASREMLQDKVCEVLFE
jgi:V/A-type H+-transporting ATPase subunit E